MEHFLRTILFIEILLANLLLFSCKKKSSDSSIQNCVYIPTTIDTTINISDNAFYSLKTNGYAFTRYGSRKIILHKESDTKYKAFDGASSYKMAEVGCLLKVDNTGFFLQDTCSGSKFDFDGNVIQEPATCPLLEYQVSFASSELLKITHFP